MKLYLKEKGEWKLFEKVTPEDLKSRFITVCDGARVCDGAMVGERSTVGFGSTVCAGATVGDGATIGDGGLVSSGATVCDGARVGDRATVGFGSTVCAGATVGDGATIGDRATVGFGSTVCAGATVGAGAMVCDGTTVRRTIDCVVLGPIGRRNAMLTGYLNDGVICCSTGCFCGPIDEFEELVKKEHAGKYHEADYLAACAYIRARMEIAKSLSKVTNDLRTNGVKK